MTQQTNEHSNARRVRARPRATSADVPRDRRARDDAAMGASHGKNAAMSRTNEPPYTKFSQQHLDAHRPTLTPRNAAAIAAAIALTFIPIGSWTYVTVGKLGTMTMRYDDVASCRSGFFATNGEEVGKYTNDGEGTTCEASARASKAMRAPVYVHYELKNFFQNHRAYVRDVDFYRMRGDFRGKYDPCTTIPHKVTDTGALISPCGTQAWSYFNDSYTVTLDGVPAAINDANIAWPSDVRYKYGTYAAENLNTNQSTRGGSTISGMVDHDEHFITWMRSAALSNFRKLWGRIDVDIPEGTEIKFTIHNRYNTYKFDGAKSIVLSENSFMGGNNPFLPALYLSVGCVNALFAIMCGWLSYSRRRSGTYAHTVWYVQPME